MSSHSQLFPSPVHSVNDTNRHKSFDEYDACVADALVALAERWEEVEEQFILVYFARYVLRL